MATTFNLVSVLSALNFFGSFCSFENSFDPDPAGFKLIRIHTVVPPHLSHRLKVSFYALHSLCLASSVQPYTTCNNEILPLDLLEIEMSYYYM